MYFRNELTSLFDVSWQWLCYCLSKMRGHDSLWSNLQIIAAQYWRIIAAWILPENLNSVPSDLKYGSSWHEDQTPATLLAYPIVQTTWIIIRNLRITQGNLRCTMVEYRHLLMSDIMFSTRHTFWCQNPTHNCSGRLRCICRLRHSTLLAHKIGIFTCNSYTRYQQLFIKLLLFKNVPPCTYFKM